MSELLWWGRLGVWVGALVLVVQAVTRQSTNAVTLIGVVLLAVSFIAFLFALRSGRWSFPETAPATLQRELPAGGPASRPASQTVSREKEVAASEAAVPGGLSAEKVRTGSEPPGRVETLEVGEGDAEVEAICPRCEQRITPGDLAAKCPVCGAVEHAACWASNRFRCATPGCTGHGSLEAPQERQRAGERDDV